MRSIVWTLLVGAAGCAARVRGSPDAPTPSPEPVSSLPHEAPPIPDLECGMPRSPATGDLWRPSDRLRWRDAMDRYEATAPLGAQVPLEEAARADFVHYVNKMHSRIHPLFADRFEKSLALLPCDHPLNDMQVKARLEIALTEDGHVKRMGIVLPSGQPDFDLGALDSVDRAQPFGPTPRTVRSFDGLAYMDWEFQRHEVYACSTMGVHPFVLAKSLEESL